MAVFTKQALKHISHFVQKASLTTASKRCLSAAAAVPSFHSSDVQVTTTSNLAPKPDPDKLTFGHHFSDHMLEIKWSEANGWEKPVICPVHNLQLHPGAKCLHYAIELFEGMKAYRGVDNKIRLFRPNMNMVRMNDTAARVNLPRFDNQELIKLMKQLISIDKEWVPYSTSSTLYVRPTFIGTEPTLGVTASNEALLFVVIGPVGPYYPTGMKPVTLMADPAFCRAFPGGVGAYKLGSNYGPTIFVQKAAEKIGCQQVLWLHGEDEQLTEVGTMNLFMFWINEQGEKELVTAPLNGIILPGVTRRSLLDMAEEWNEFKVKEEIWTMKQVMKGLKENRVLEIFGAGTACVVAPVEKILYNGKMLEIPTMKQEPSMCNRFLTSLTDIQVKFI